MISNYIEKGNFRFSYCIYHRCKVTGLFIDVTFYLYDGKDATEITGPLSLDVIDSCIENIEEGDIEY